MPKRKTTIKEELSKNLKDTLAKAADNMVEELDISVDEANYVAGVYGQLKDRDLFKASYIRDIELEADPGEKIPDITNLQQMVNYPELMYKIVTLVLFEAKEFLSKYEIIYSPETKGVSFKKRKQKKKQIRNKVHTPWDKYKTAEDDNWMTFRIPTYDGKLKMFYQNVFNDPRIKHHKASSFYTTNWCVFTSPGYFESQKDNNPRNTWNFTVSKINPADRIIKYVEATDLPDHVKKTLIDAINDPSSLNSTLEGVFSRVPTQNGKAYNNNFNEEVRNANLGELFLLHRDGSNYSRYGRGNFGFHLYTNHPQGAVDTSYLVPSKNYNYFGLSDVSEPFSISEGGLFSYNNDDTVVVIPEGVVSIEKNAFTDKGVNTLVLPKTLTTIKSGAFSNCPYLEHIRATNALAYISQNAFDSITVGSGIVLGVFTEEKGQLVVKKPFNLTHYPKNILKKSASEEVEDPEEVTESKKPLVEKIRIKNVPLYDYENENLVIEHGVLEFRDAASGKNFGDVVIPEGVTKLVGKIKGSYGHLVFPKTFIGWEEENTSVIETRAKIETLDLSKTNGIRVIGNKAFFFSRISNMILPDTVLVIGKYAFIASKIKTIYIPSSVEEIDEKAFHNTGLLDTILTDNPEVLMQKLENVTLRSAPDIVKRNN
jgi:hypothetical protein